MVVLTCDKATKMLIELWAISVKDDPTGGLYESTQINGITFY